ncbi:MAG: hypothetical protein U9N49_10980 [Campylobacterota bacterium]|nr:hypothetical protein [Campylobacterota bacterium]
MKQIIFKLRNYSDFKTILRVAYASQAKNVTVEHIDYLLKEDEELHTNLYYPQLHDYEFEIFYKEMQDVFNISNIASTKEIYDALDKTFKELDISSYADFLNFKYQFVYNLGNLDKDKS